MDNYEEELIDLMELLEKSIYIAVKYSKILIAVLMLFTAIVPVYKYYTYTPLYSSQITFAVTKEVNGNSSFQYNQDAVGKIKETFEYLLSSPQLIDKMKSDMNSNTLSASLSLSQIQSTNLFSVKATSYDANNAYKVINAFKNNYSSFSRILLDGSSLTLVEDSELSYKPVNSVSISDAAIKGLLIGAVIDVLIIGIIYIIKRTIHTKEDIKKHLHSKCLANVPYIKKYKKINKYLLTTSVNNSLFKESFEDISYEISRDAKEYNNKIFVITSCLSSEGKSTIAANTALSLSKKNKKVLLIDLDLRNPSQYKLFSLNHDKEISDIIKNKQLDKDSIIKHESIHILLQKSSIDNPTELLSNDYLKLLLEELREHFDYIIIDTPPVYMMDDGLIVSQYADSLVVVTKQDYVSTHQILETLDSISEIKPHILGIVLNQVKSMPLRVGNKYGYGYGYGYRYGYGYKKNK